MSAYQFMTAVGIYQPNKTDIIEESKEKLKFLAILKFKKRKL